MIPTLKAIRLIRRLKPNVVHLHNLHGYYVNIYKILAYLKRNGTRTIITTHDENYYTGKCTYTYGCQKYMSNCGKCPQLKDYPSTLLDRSSELLSIKNKIFQGWNNVEFVSPSQWVINQRNNSIISDKPIVKIANSVDESIFNLVSTDYDKELNNIQKPYYLFISNDLDDERKGFQFVKSTIIKYPELEKHIVIVGDTSKSIPHSELTHFNKIKDKRLLAALYRNANALLMFSKLESFGMVCYEAALCGTITIGFDVGGVKEAAAINSILFPYKDDNVYESIYKDYLKKAKVPSIVLESKFVMEDKYLELYRSNSPK